jgi:type 1 glutamine amidotransferase
MSCRIAVFFALISLALLPASSVGAQTTKIVLIAGTPSHGPGEHEFNAGTTILTNCLKKISNIEPVMVKGGWPTDESVFEGAKTVVFYMDGGSNHPMIKTKERMALMQKLMDRGVGLVCLHYAVEFPKGEVGDKLLDWLGGYYETGYSTNPINDVLMTPAAMHGIVRGVSPFQIQDEWYYKMRFRSDDSRVVPILTTQLPKDNPKTEICAWATRRENMGRSFGFTGAHFHKNWGNKDFRTLVLNAILWTAHVRVPREGVASEVTAEELKVGLDPK